MADALVKPDPEAQGASPVGFGDETLYEDTHDELEFSSNQSFQSLFLARIPHELWEAWSKLPDDAEIRLGTIRQIETVDSNGTKRESYHMLLSSEVPQHQLIPREYDMDVMEEDVNNTYIFSEQNLPGYKKGNYERDRENNIPANLRKRDERQRLEIKAENGDSKKRMASYNRKPVAKRTCLAGKIRHEFNCVAIEEEVERALIRRMQQVKREAPRTIYHSNMINTSMLGALDRFANFVRTDQPVGVAKPQTLKAARIPLNELRDAIFTCFRQYKYWSMKALRNKLQQPEAYLRETLDGMAVLARSGPFTGNWFLKPESTGYIEGMADFEAPVKEEGGDTSVAEEDEDDDVDVDFEDVVGT